MKYFIKGLLRIIIALLLFPIIALVSLVEIVFCIGGKDPFNTPITPIRNKLAGIIFGND